MKAISLIVVLIFMVSLLACTSDKKASEVSDSAITAPVDTLGGDTTHVNPMGDSVKTEVDTAK